MSPAIFWLDLIIFIFILADQLLATPSPISLTCQLLDLDL